MDLNWKRGLTRLYFVAWAPWLLFVVLRTISVNPAVLFGPLPLTIVLGVALWGLVFPAFLLVALRWAAAGFLR